MTQTIEVGLVKGETCNRDGCQGIIDEHEKEGGCSCHINPPCSYCTTDAAYCPECNWHPEDDIPPVDTEMDKKNREYYQRENEKWAAQRKSFYRKYNGQEPIEKLEMRNESHTHFSQIIIGVFPKGTETRASIEEKAIGTFGGRFELWNPERGSFKYIAYTD